MRPSDTNPLARYSIGDPLSLFWEQFQRINETRCERWHPKGLNEWSRQDWMNALAGEVWELIAADPQDKPLEAADVATYAIIFASSEGDHDFGKRLDEQHQPPSPLGMSDIVLTVEASMERLHSAVKEHSRNRDGAAGKGFTEEELHDIISANLEVLVEDLISWSLSDPHSPQLQVSCAIKFDQVSARQNFPERAPDFKGCPGLGDTIIKGDGQTLVVKSVAQGGCRLYGKISGSGATIGLYWPHPDWCMQ